MTEKKKTKKRKAPLVILSMLLLVGGGALGTLTWVQHQVDQFDQVIADNVWVNTLDIGGMTPEEAKKTVTDYVSTQLKESQITLKVKDQSIPLSYEQLGMSYNVDQTLIEALSIGHEGDLFDRYRYMKQNNPEPTHLTLVATYPSEQVAQLITEKLEAFYKAPVDAQMIRKNRAFHITPEKLGEQANITPVIEQVAALLDVEKTGEVQVEFVSLAPKYNTQNIKDLQTPLASFNTSYNNADPHRNKNLALATQKINTVLQPNEKFKYSDYIEPITAAAGFESSKVIVNGVIEDGVGGGICQVSTTLYNAVLLTDLNIYMRRNHSLPVAYVPLGRDATYATDSVDFQFINNTGHPLYIESYCENNKVYVNIFGHKDAKPTYESKFESVFIEMIDPPAPKYVNDPTLEVGVEIQKTAPKQGKKIELYKYFYKNGELINKKKINTSIYKPTGEVIRRGTKPIS